MCTSATGLCTHRSFRLRRTDPTTSDDQLNAVILRQTLETAEELQSMRLEVEVMNTAEEMLDLHAKAGETWDYAFLVIDGERFTYGTDGLDVNDCLSYQPGHQKTSGTLEV